MCLVFALVSCYLNRCPNRQNYIFLIFVSFRCRPRKNRSAVHSPKIIKWKIRSAAHSPKMISNSKKESGKLNPEQHAFVKTKSRKNILGETLLRDYPRDFWGVSAGKISSNRDFGLFGPVTIAVEPTFERK